MTTTVLGLHHVTAIAGDPQRNVDFYTGILGLRLVKQTVNFDDPQTYHFYFGDTEGHPGTLLTFFPWPLAGRGRPGVGQVAVTAFAVIPEALAYWHDRLRAHEIAFKPVTGRFNDQGLAFKDPDGLLLEIVGHPTADPARAWARGPIPPDYAVRGLHSVTTWVQRPEATGRVLTDVLGFRVVGEAPDLIRFAAGAGGPGTFVDVRATTAVSPGASGTGTVHHVAFRAADDAAQLEVRREVVSAGLRPTPVIDRQYFHSVYFHEPGGVLYEVATDPPGFLIDEPLDTLGQHLELPPQYGSYREEIERVLPRIKVPLPSAPGAHQRSLAQDAQIQRNEPQIAQ
jgi:glyoxalase family protein